MSEPQANSDDPQENKQMPPAPEPQYNEAPPPYSGAQAGAAQPPYPTYPAQAAGYPQPMDPAKYPPVGVSYGPGAPAGQQYAGPPPPGQQYAGQPPIGQNPNMTVVQQAQPVATGTNVVVVRTGNCPLCGVGRMVEDFTWMGIILGIFFFPCGLICMFSMRQKRCTHCGPFM